MIEINEIAQLALKLGAGEAKATQDSKDYGTTPVDVFTWRTERQDGFGKYMIFRNERGQNYRHQYLSVGLILDGKIKEESHFRSYSNYLNMQDVESAIECYLHIKI